MSVVFGSSMKSDDWNDWADFIRQLSDKKKTVGLLNLLQYELSCDEASYLRFYKSNDGERHIRYEASGESIFSD